MEFQATQVMSDAPIDLKDVEEEVEEVGFSADEADNLSVPKPSNFELEILEKDSSRHPNNWEVLESHLLLRGMTVLGRNETSSLENFPEASFYKILHPTISRSHSIIHIEGTDVFLEDLGSTNGSRRQNNGRLLKPSRLYEVSTSSATSPVFFVGSQPVRIRNLLKEISKPAPVEEEQETQVRKRKRGVISPSRRAPPTQESDEAESEEYETPPKAQRKSPRIASPSRSQKSSSLRKAAVPKKPKEIPTVFMWTGFEPKMSQLAILKKFGWTHRADLAALRNKKVTHIVADKIRRTVKLLVAVSQGIPVVSSDYLHSCVEKNKLLQPTNYLLKDADGETKFEMNLAESLRKARISPFLTGYSVFMCHSVKIVNRNDMKLIVQASGGSWLDHLKHSEREEVLVIATESDKVHYKCRMFRHDLILNGAMAQELKFEKHMIQPAQV